MREQEYQIIRNDKDKVLGNIWWDGKKIQADNKQILGMVKDAVVNGLSFADGKEFLEHLPSLFKDGYATAKRVKK